MDIIENWNLLNERIKEDPEKKQLIAELMPIHMGAFDDLRNSGHMISIGGKEVSEMIVGKDAFARLDLAGNVGRSLVDLDGSLFEKNFRIKMADQFPNCIFIAIAAVIENLDGALNAVYPDKKMKVNLSYESAPESSDPFGKLIPLFEKCYSWISVSTEKKTAQENAPEKAVSGNAEAPSTAQSAAGNINDGVVDISNMLFLIPVQFEGEEGGPAEQDDVLHFCAAEVQKLRSGSKIQCPDLPDRFKDSLVKVLLLGGTPADEAHTLHYQIIESPTGQKYIPLFDSYSDMVRICGDKSRVA